MIYLYELRFWYHYMCYYNFFDFFIMRCILDAEMDRCKCMYMLYDLDVDVCMENVWNAIEFELCYMYGLDRCEDVYEYKMIMCLWM